MYECIAIYWENIVHQYWHIVIIIGSNFKRCNYLNRSTNTNQIFMPVFFISGTDYFLPDSLSWDRNDGVFLTPSFFTPHCDSLPFKLQVPDLFNECSKQTAALHFFLAATVVSFLLWWNLFCFSLLTVQSPLNIIYRCINTSWLILSLSCRFWRQPQAVMAVHNALQIYFRNQK